MSDKMRRNEKRIIRVTLFLIGLGAAVFFILRDSLNNLWYVFFLGVLVVKIFPLIFFGNREERVLRYFRRKSNVRIQLVEEIVNKADPVDELLEPMEVVAVFSTLIAKHGVSHAVHLMTNLSHRGWDNYFNEDFFGLILPTSRELRRVGLKNDYIGIIQFAGAAAGQHNKKDLAKTFKKKSFEIMKERGRNIRPVRMPRK